MQPLAKSIVVLPFVNMSSDEDNEYFSDGITEEIINALTKIPDLKVIARTSAFAFKGKQVDIRTIAAQLGVTTVLEGSIRKAANRVRITAQFINADDGTHYWSKNYDRELHDIFAIQDEISLLIAEELRENFGHFEIKEDFVRHESHPVQAYDWYLKGLFSLKRKDLADIKQAIHCFNEAVRIDVNYADAYACLAESYVHYMAFSEMDHGEAYLKINEYVQTALTLDKRTARAYKIDAYMKLFAWDWTGAKKAYENAIANGLPNENEFISYYYIFVENQKEYAIELAKKLLLTDPLHAFSHWQLGACYYFNKQWQEALEAFNYALQLEPEFGEALRWKGLVLGYLRRFDEALPLLNKALQVTKGQMLARLDLMVVKILMGRIDEVVLEVEHTEFKDPCDPAMIYAIMNKPDRAMPFLQKGFEERNLMLISLKHFFVWDNLRHREDFNGLIADMNFPKPPFLIPGVQAKSNNEKLLLDDTTIKGLTTTLDKLMNTDKLYTDAALSLRSLATYLDTTANKLSWLLNEHYQQNFNEYVNSYRLADFKERALAEENRNLTLLAIAYDSGFNSKTVFNTCFKKYEGITPKAWLKQQQC